MAITLSPAVNTLGITAPVLGPWFSDNTVNLPALTPAKNLGLTVNIASNTDWYAPATGTLSLFITNGANPPAALDALQDSTGAWPFPNNRIVAYFRLFPEVEARLHELMGLVPAATQAPISTLPTTLAAPTRAQVRSFAMVLPNAGPNFLPSDIYPYFYGLNNLPGDDAERMVALGLAINKSGNVVNGPVAMTWLRRPGGAAANRDKLLTALSGNVDLWAFDRRGRAVDPGAIACWWSWLLNTGVGADPATGTTDIQLLAPSITASDYPQQNGQPVVVQFAAQQTVHLVDAHEGPLGDPFIDGRLQNGGAAVTGNLIQITGNGPNFSFSALPAPGTTPPADNPQVDNAPRARIAVLPVGAYGTTANPWPSGPVHTGLNRDFVRVAVVEEESHLTGITRRDSRQAVSSPSERRQSAQNRPSTRINVNRTATSEGVLLANSQAVADALLALPNTAAATRMVLGIADTAWGGTPGAAASGPAPGAGPLPVSLTDAGTGAPAANQYRVQALTGGGTAAENFQTVFVQVNLGSANAGAWVRCWPLGFDLTKGEHIRLSGGSGRADTNGLACLVMTLPKGLVASLGLMGLDMLVILPGPGNTIAALRHYADRRFTRPEPVDGTAANAVRGTWVICEAGITGTVSLPNGSVPPGGHVVLLDTTPPTLLDRAFVPAAAWDASTLLNRIQGATDIVSLTSPAYDAAPDRADASGRPLPSKPTSGGNPAGGLDTVVGNRLHLLNRGVLSGVTASSVPYSLMDRLEVAAATVPGTGALAVIGSAPPTPWSLAPVANQFLGFPGVPASIETHGTGVNLSGSPAVAVAEYVRERTAGLNFNFIQELTEPVRSAAIQSELAVVAEAANPVLPAPTDGAGAGPVVAVLRTSALGMEGLPGAAEGAMASTSLFPFSKNESALEGWLDAQISISGGAGTQLRNAVGNNIDAMTRALDRRLFTAAYGAREMLIALLAAIDRAQDFIYIETPGVDNITIDSGGENLQLWQRLINRMSSRKGLRVALCVPTKLGFGTPQMLQDVRNHCLMDAVDAIRNAHTDRFALFSPGVGAGRALRLASTSVVVDDAIAFTGTTHLSRRGQTWDSSLAAAVFDEQITDGRPTDVRAFRMQLMADRLGIPTTRLPDDPAELVKAIRDLDKRGSNKLSVMPILRPKDNTPANTDIDVWNPDGSKSGISLSSIVTLFASAAALTDTEHAVIDG